MIENFKAVGLVEAMLTHSEDDFRGGEEACTTLTDQFAPDALHRGNNKGKITSNIKIGM